MKALLSNGLQSTCFFDYCQECKTECSKKATLSITHISKSLIIKLERLVTDKSKPISTAGEKNSYETTKIKAKVPLEEKIPTRWLLSTADEDSSMVLRAVISHKTSPSHFVTYTRDNDGWLLHDDNQVSKVTFLQVSQSFSTLLFFQAQTKQKTAELRLLGAGPGGPPNPLSFKKQKGLTPA
jgi:ubiquitin C-terminal hydrolase